jgi:hypothetical protein
MHICRKADAYRRAERHLGFGDEAAWLKRSGAQGRTSRGQGQHGFYFNFTLFKTDSLEIIPLELNFPKTSP